MTVVPFATPGELRTYFTEGSKFSIPDPRFKEFFQAKNKKIQEGVEKGKANGKYKAWRDKELERVKKSRQSTKLNRFQSMKDIKMKGVHDHHKYTGNKSNIPRHLRTGPRGPKAPNSRNHVISKSGGAFQKARRFKKSKYARPGVQLQYEYRDGGSDPQSLYLGYGTPTYRFLEAAVFCLVKKMFQLHGFEIENFDQTIPGPSSAATKQWTVYINYWQYISSTGLSTLTITHDYSAGKITYQDMVTQIISAMDTAFTSGNGVPIFNKMELYAGIVATPQGTALVYMDLQNVSFDFNYKAKLQVQNVTQASTTDAVISKLDTGRIDVNPIVGWKYKASGTNGIVPRIRDDATAAGWLPLTADLKTGLFETTSVLQAGATFTSLAAIMGSAWYKTPDPCSFTKVKAVKVILEPGEIKTDYQRYKTRLTLQKLMTKIFDQVQSATGSVTAWVPLGCITMFAFEHKLKQQTSDSDVAVDYQGDYEVACLIHYKKPATVPVVRVSS